MFTRPASCLALAAVLLVAGALPCAADGPKAGFSISVEGDGFFLNPVVTRIRVTNVEKGSLAAKAGIVAGDEIIQIEGQAVAGKRARDLQPYMTFNAGETRNLRLRHASGEPFDAHLTKPKN